MNHQMQISASRRALDQIQLQYKQILRIGVFATLVSSTSFPSAGNQLQVLVLKTNRGRLDWLREVDCFMNGYHLCMSYILKKKTRTIL